MEACVTLGMLTDDQARRLAEAGLTAYNHNLDTSRRHYPNVVTTRTYDDRLRHAAGRAAGRHLGLLRRHPRHGRDRGRPPACCSSSWPTSTRRRRACRSTAWCRIAGHAAGDGRRRSIRIELVRLIATARIAFPKARVRLSAGRDRMSRELQVLCFLAGANSIFFGDKLLTAPNPSADGDAELFRAMGLPVAVREPCHEPDRSLADARSTSCASQGRYRALPPPAGIDFSSNDYLGYGNGRLPSRRRRTDALAAQRRPPSRLPAARPPRRLGRGRSRAWPRGTAPRPR